MSSRTTGSGRTTQGGTLVTTKHDFNVHAISGTDWRHKADHIDMNPVIADLGGSTVQQTLEQLHTSISSSGSGFISIGKTDGYASGTYDVGSADYPTLKSAIDAAVTDPRLVNGGIILLLAGTYTTSQTITIPAGISLMGEVDGTLIIGETTEQPMFLIKQANKDVRIGGDSGSGPVRLDTGSNIHAVKFFNLMLADNLNGSSPTMTTVPMIRMENSANFICERVSFIGKLANGTVTNRAKTLCAVKTTSGGVLGSSLKMIECFMDGMKIGIDFRPGLGNSDYLTVERTKARLYGTDGGNTTVSENCFILSSLCNAKISNNFTYMAGSTSRYFLNFTSASSTTDIFCTIVGNSGKSASETSLTSYPVTAFITNDSGTTFRCTAHGNTWGPITGSPWCIVVGGADTNSPIGDIFGPNAINTVISIAANNNDIITCIINPGTYTVNGGSSLSQNSTNLSLIGNKNGIRYPLLNIDITEATSTDSYISQRVLKLGNKVQSIYFNSLNRTHSIEVRFGEKPSGGAKVLEQAHTMEVVDCVFVNTSLLTHISNSTTTTDQNGKDAQTTVHIENCHFFQDSTFDNTVSLCLTPQNNVFVRGCSFRGNGYFLNAGTNVASKNVTNSNYIFEDCTVDQTGYSITLHNAGLNSNFFDFKDSNAKVTLKNCQILSTNLFKGSEIYASGLLNDNLIDSYIQITASEIVIDGCTFSGPDQLLTISAVQYAMPTLRLTPYYSCYISNSRFLGGALPAQVHATNTFSTASAGGNATIDIHNCEFRNHSSSDGSASSLGASIIGKGYTLLDIDVNISTFPPYGSVPKINISNNTFNSIISNSPVNSGSADTPYQVKHATAYAYHNAVGVVQVYAAHCNINFSNNSVYANKIITLTGSPSAYKHYSLLAINNYNYSGGATGRLTSSIIEGNHLLGRNGHTSLTSTDSASALWVIGPILRIHNNTLGLKNLISPSSAHFIGSLYINSASTNAIDGASDAVVSGNTFTRRDFTGTGGTGSANGNSLGYVFITSDSERGSIIGNTFSDTTIDGILTTLVSDNSVAANKWLVKENKNQTETVTLLNGDFIFSLTNGDGNYEFLGYHSTASTGKVVTSVLNGKEFDLYYHRTGTAQFFQAHAPLWKLIPSGVKVTKIKYDYSFNTEPNTTKSLELDLRYGATVQQDFTSTPPVSGTRTLTLSGTIRNTPDNFLYLFFEGRINHSLAGTIILTISNFEVTYTY